MTTFRFQGACS